MLGRAGGAFIHVRSFLDRCGRVDREKREATRPEMERRVVRETGPRGTTRETPFLELVPDYFEFMPREVRFFQDWEASARSQRVFAHRALDVRDYIHKREREIGFIPRPHKMPHERLQMTPETSVHQLMNRNEAIDREVALPFGWFFLMTHGHWVEPDVGLAIAEGLKRSVSACVIPTQLCCFAGPSGPTVSEARYGRHRQRPIPRRVPARPGA